MKLVAEYNPVLWTPAKPVEDIPAALVIMSEMYKIMIENGGVGLAAPQIGLSLRMFIMRHQKGYEIFINPEILDKSPHGKTDWEGCLSKPGYRTKVRRPNWVAIRFFDGEKMIEGKCSGMTARIVLHEIDHLDGICLWENPNKLQRY